jgi:hypothetical protein
LSIMRPSGLFWGLLAAFVGTPKLSALSWRSWWWVVCRGRVIVGQSHFSETFGLLRGSETKGRYLTNETNFVNFLTFVYIFRSVRGRGRVSEDRARGGWLLRRVKGAALNNPVSS